MSRPLESLPQPLLDEIVDAVLLVAPSLRGAFLSSLGSCLHASAVRILFHTISLQDKAPVFTLEESPSRAAYHVLANPLRYASAVKTLVITLHPEDADALLNERPIDADLLVRLLGICPNLERLAWESAFPPPDGLCEVIAAHNSRLLRVAFTPPPLASSQRCSLAKWDAPSLPLLSGLPSLTSLCLCRLSQAGARAFATLLENLGDDSLLESLNIDFVWLDDPLCEKIVDAGRKIQKLSLTTSGTKLSDKGIVVILEGCDALEEFVLDEVQGRLSRTLWTKPTCFPPALKTLRIVVAEAGPHHSWATDHLDSLHAVPLGSLSCLDVVRREALPSLHCGVAIYDGIVDDAVALKPIPPAFMNQIKQQKSQMTSFRCDFWSFSIADIKLLLEYSPKLECTQLCLDAPFAKLIGLTSTFASLSSLRTLSVSITPVHAPGKPPSPILPSSSSGSSPTSLPTPTESPVLKSKSVLPQLLDFDQMQTQTCHSETPGDPSMPLLREIKRFVRKCPQLEVIEWYGKNGRGSWVLTRPSTSSKISINVSVEYIAPKVTEEVWNAIIREKSIEDAIKRGWGGFAEIERAGHTWTGETAEAFAAERLAAEKEKEEAAAPPSPVERVGKSREAGKRVRIPSVSISSSSGSDVLLPLTPTTSPVQQTPLTPPLSDHSVSETDAAWLRDCTSSNRKRSPSTPSAQNAGAPKQRTRSSTAASSNSKDAAGDRNGVASGTTSSRGAKSSRGRGGNVNSNTRGPRKPAGTNTPGAEDALWAAGYDESVEVNQRALIDKVLARYSGEFTVFRELLQNSDDAQSKRVEIRFQTQTALNPDRDSDQSAVAQKLPDLKTALCHQWTFKNDGMAFRKEDWDRLKKIAEGNPDEEKIGAFGVGFYSLFSVTDDPLVKSGSEWMGFYWKDNKDQLFARRGPLPPTTPDDPDRVWTSFEMPLRQPVPAPVAFDFIRFLASSITFMQWLSEVSVYFDEKRLVRLRKESGVPKPLGIPKGLQNRSRLGTMTITGVNSTSLRIQADTMRWVYSSGTEKPKPPVLKQEKAAPSSFFSLKSWLGSNTPQRVTTPLPPEPEEVVDPLTVNETSVSLSIFSAEADVRLDKKVAAELHRSTKKNPPNKVKYQLIYTAKDEYDASKKEDEQQPFATGSIFQGLRADIEGTGSARVFIGHATGQTTGLGGHMAARFIPTVERESIDLMDRNVAMWNKELLWVGGFLARTAYERELADVRDLWNGAIQGTPSDKDLELKSWLQGRALHALQFFSFHPSTPSADVSALLEASFFSCAPNHDFPLMSTVGVRQASAVRFPDSRFSFLKELPVLPEEVKIGAGRMVEALRVRGLIKPILLRDVLSELRARPLAEADMIACLKWWIDSYAANPDPAMLPVRTELLNAAVLILGKPGSAEEQIIQLGGIKTFMNPRSLIPLDSPLPPHLLPLVISKHLPSASIASSFPWDELAIGDWLRYICSPAVRGPGCPVAFNLDLSPQWAERVLSVLAAAWPSLSNDAKVDIVTILKNVPCIPTSGGLKIPEESYFVKADLFHDLPVVTLPSGILIRPALEKLLSALGTRRHVDLQVVFDRQVSILPLLNS
ncbi:hypothetical protein MVEN_00549400 [Mycena venus]|uniref:Sacsin/Nov domain-containing protein n=1 Tax=Mycena venus TaxID=2733690 RepID=A0A8H6YJ21_9AGAR|nr:hypothetical protein MVEN_00549400 [Mycena venus]